MVSELLSEAPSANTVRTYVKAVLSDEEGLTELDRWANVMLVSRLPITAEKQAFRCTCSDRDCLPLGMRLMMYLRAGAK